MKKIEFTPVFTVSICMVVELIFLCYSSFMEFHRNGSYLGWVVVCAVSTIIVANILVKMIESDYISRIESLKVATEIMHQELMNHTMNHTRNRDE